MREIPRRQLRFGLAFMVLLHLGIIALFLFDVIPGAHQQGTYLFHTGGDQDDYFALARSILDGHLIQSKYTLGFPLLLIPWLVVFQPATSTAMIPPVAIFHSIVLFPLAQLVLASLALRITHHRTAALLSVFVWTILPLGVYLALALTGRAQLGAIWAIHLPWPQMLSDPPATFLTLLSFRLMFSVLDTPVDSVRRQWLWAGLLGIVCGSLLLIRVNSVLSVIAVALVLVVTRRWTALVVIGVLSLIFLMPQFIYNAAYFGSPFVMGYTVLDKLPPNGLFNWVYPLKVLTSKYALLAWGGLVLLGALLGGGLYAMRRREPYGALAVGVWAVLYLVFFGFYYYSWTGGITRFLMPAYPALAMLVACLPLLMGLRETVQLSVGRMTDA